MVLDLLTGFAGIPITVGASEAVHRQRILDDEAEAEERQEEFYLDVFCDAQSRKKDEVHNAIVVLKDGKVRNFRPICPPQHITNDAYRSAYGRKMPKPSFLPLIRILRMAHPTRSPAFTSHSLPKIFPTVRYLTHPLLVSSALYRPRRTPNQHPQSQS
jgi:hypothetical protein